MCPSILIHPRNMNGITHHLKLQDVDLWALSDAWAAARAPGVPGAQREHSGSTE